jgi:hypothetical protein
MSESPRKPEPRPGRGPLRTVIKLVIASLIVGAIFAFLGLSPIGFWRGVFDAVRSLIALLGNSIGEVALNLATYLVLGGAVVVPVWMVTRLLSSRRDRGPPV